MERKDPKREPGEFAESGYEASAYSALEGAGFGFTKALYIPDADAERAAAPEVDQSLSGDDIRARVEEALREEPSVDSSRIRISVAAGAVVLEGTVPEGAMRYFAGNIAARFAAEVSNHLEIVTPAL
jgi:hypothetical protein